LKPLICPCHVHLHDLGLDHSETSTCPDLGLGHEKMENELVWEVWEPLLPCASSSHSSLSHAEAASVTFLAETSIALAAGRIHRGHEKHHVLEIARGVDRYHRGQHAGISHETCL